MSGQAHTPGPRYAAEAYKACLYGNGEPNQQRSVAGQLALANGVKGELVSVLTEVKELLRFALLTTTPDIAQECMVFVRRADAVIAKAQAEPQS